MHIRPLHQADEMKAASLLEARIWGGSDLTPPSLLLVFAHHGGVVLGALDNDQLIGVSVGFPGLDKKGVSYLHSHLLGVLPRYRRQRVGEALKWAQWEYAENAGFPYVGWTYDPLMAANAWFNLGVLGARVADVLDNAYGRLDDEINGSLPTHRFWVTWAPHPSLPRDSVSDGPLLEIPEDVIALRQRDPEQARELADHYFQQIAHYWHTGFRVAGVVRENGRVWYRWQDERKEVER